MVSIDLMAQYSVEISKFHRGLRMHAVTLCSFTVFILSLKDSFDSRQLVHCTALIQFLVQLPGCWEVDIFIAYTSQEIWYVYWRRFCIVLNVQWWYIISLQIVNSYLFTLSGLFTLVQYYFLASLTNLSSQHHTYSEHPDARLLETHILFEKQ